MRAIPPFPKHWLERETLSGLYADRLPPRTFNPDELLAQVGKVERADPYVIELNREAIAEAHARLGAVLGEG